MKETIRYILFLLLFPTVTTAQNKYNVEADIERAVKDFFYNISEMNNPVEPIRPESFASSYQKGINVFKVNDGIVKMSFFSLGINSMCWRTIASVIKYRLKVSKNCLRTTDMKLKECCNVK